MPTIAAFKDTIIIECGQEPSNREKFYFRRYVIMLRKWLRPNCLHGKVVNKCHTRFEFQCYGLKALSPFELRFHYEYTLEN